MKKIYIAIVISLLLIIPEWIFVSCVRDEDYITDSSVVLKFSQDTVSFDTIFTTVGSVTKRVTVYNKESEAVKINSITLSRESLIKAPSQFLAYKYLRPNTIKEKYDIVMINKPYKSINTNNYIINTLNVSEKNYINSGLTTKKFKNLYNLDY